MSSNDTKAVVRFGAVVGDVLVLAMWKGLMGIADFAIDGRQYAVMRSTRTAP